MDCAIGMRYSFHPIKVPLIIFNCIFFVHEALNTQYFINICVCCCLKVSVTYYLDRIFFFIGHVSPSRYTIVCNGII